MKRHFKEKTMPHQDTSSALTRSLALDELPPPYLYLGGSVIIGACLALFILWSAVTPVDEVASASGQVIPNGHVQMVQHLEGGIVRKILVTDGQQVEVGQILVILDPIHARTDLDRLKSRQNALQLQAERLRQFANEAHYRPTSSKDLTDNERVILNSMEEARQKQKDVLHDQIAQKHKEITGIRAMRMTLNKNKTLVEQEHAMHAEMARNGVGSQLTAMTSRRELNQITGQVQELGSQEARAQDAVRELQSRLQAVDADLKQDTMKNLGLIEAELDDIHKSMMRAQDTLKRTQVVSPVRGIVKGLTLYTEGGVVEPGKSLMEVVPVEKELLIEAMLPPSEIGNVREGQPVKVKISAYDFSRFGNIEGWLDGISASTFQGEEGQTFYKVKIRLERNYVGNNPERHVIVPGMQAQVDIVTGDKTILQYLLKPVRVAMDKAFSES